MKLNMYVSIVLVMGSAVLGQGIANALLEKVGHPTMLFSQLGVGLIFSGLSFGSLMIKIDKLEKIVNQLKSGAK